MTDACRDSMREAGMSESVVDIYKNGLAPICMFQFQKPPKICGCFGIQVAWPSKSLQHQSEIG